MTENCICCGAEIPEGRQVCPSCERAIRHWSSSEVSPDQKPGRLVNAFDLVIKISRYARSFGKLGDEARQLYDGIMRVIGGSPTYAEVYSVDMDEERNNENENRR